MATSQQKADGCYFTPIELARILARWAVRTPYDRVLEPSCGDGVFLVAAIERLRDLEAAPEDVRSNLWAVEKNPEPIRVPPGAGNIDVARWFERMIQADFFELSGPQSGLIGEGKLSEFDVVLGNPPYVRYQLFAGTDRTKGLERAREHGVDLRNLASMWAPFLIHAAGFVSPRGRLAMVLPAELIHVQYAGPVRQFLLSKFERVCIVKFDKKVFPGALEEVVVLLAERRSRSRGLHVAQVTDIDDLKSRFQQVVRAPALTVATPSEKWSPYLLEKQVYKAFKAIASPERFRPLGDLASVDIGIVTGANDFFFLSPGEAESFGIGARHLKPAVSKAAHVAGCLFDPAAWFRLEQRDDKCELLLIDKDAATRDRAVRRYIERGERLGIHERYKCRIRTPWYALRRHRVPDAFLCYMAGDIPRMALNEAKGLNSNTIHSVNFRLRSPALIRAQVVAFYNSVTLLSCELFARSYGGGVLKIEPTEAERLLVPRLESDKVIARLSRMAREIDHLVREKRVDEAVARVDEVLLRQALRVGVASVQKMSQALLELRCRRLARSGGQNAHR
ncbi:MAG: SAM-dependent DNA methyltransferase [Planctomycetia bacterium]|nr:SAM-dependent DNA methyltransferase [Planctomycetia bacterium]